MIGRMLGTWRRPTLLAKVGAGLGVALFLVAALAASPYFIRSRVDEPFPAAQVVAQPTDDMMMEPTADAMTEPTTDTMADAMTEPTTDTMAEAMTEPTTDAMTEPTTDTMAEAMTEPTADTMAHPAITEPVALGQGMFTTMDAIHAAEGTATIFRLPDGAHVLRLEEFDSTNGPDLYIGLSGHPMPRSNDELHQNGYVELARLKAPEGSQNYELPADLDVSRFRSVVIYCRAFSVVFSTAELIQPSSF